MGFRGGGGQFDPPWFSRTPAEIGLKVFYNVHLTVKIKVLLPAGHVHLVQVNTEQDLLSVFTVSTLAN